MLVSGVESGRDNMSSTLEGELYVCVDSIWHPLPDMHPIFSALSGIIGISQGSTLLLGGGGCLGGFEWMTFKVLYCLLTLS